MHLFTQFHNFVGQMDDLVIKARVFDETVAKALPMTGANVINIVVDYSSKMETLLVEMWKLMVRLHPAAIQQPIVLDLSKFSEIPGAEILQGLATPMKTTGTNRESFGLPIEPNLDSWTRQGLGQLPATSLLEIVTTISKTPMLVPPLSSSSAPLVPPPPLQSPAKLTSTLRTTSTPLPASGHLSHSTCRHYSSSKHSGNNLNPPSVRHNSNCSTE